MFPVTPECQDGEASHLTPVQSPLAKFDVDEASIDWGNDMIQSVRSEQWRITRQWTSEVEQHRGGGVSVALPVATDSNIFSRFY